MIEDGLQSPAALEEQQPERQKRGERVTTERERDGD